MTQSDDLTQLDAAAAITDPVRRIQALGSLVTQYEGLVRAAAGLRRQAITDAIATGMTQERLARELGVSPGRVSQMRKAATGTVREAESRILTGWLAETAGETPASIAICGSRATGASAKHLDAAVLSLAELLMRRRYLISHGPVGVGAEVLTYIADQHHPEGLDAVRGIIGHDNVVREAEYILVVGGGAGTQAEIDTAFNAGKRVLPMPASGGTAARVYMRMLGDEGLRSWLPDATFSALATADARQFAELADAVTSREG